MMVSICCLTYNHEKFIGQAIDSFRMQQVDFPVEIIIHDDASTDNTRRVICDRIKDTNNAHVIFRTRNLYQRTQCFPIDKCYVMARGKYIALCDGDDYWTDVEKLSKQVAFMEMHANHSLCYHDHIIDNQGVFFTPAPVEDLLKRRESSLWCRVHTSTLLFRSSLVQNLHPAMMAHWPFLSHARARGHTKYMHDIKPSVYRRRHGGNAWCELNPTQMAERTEAARLLIIGE
jgi:glycosyltransferase involved in cell wall biosynthesis